MTLLAPLYIAGLVALSLPILFHLIRRTPQGRQAFSSLMFLSPSPPRLTRRSRLSNILLLILRALALALLALAFARPFFLGSADADPSAGKGKRIAILVDVSASMRRGDLWQQAKNQVAKTLADVTPADEVSLFLFDRQVRAGFTFTEWNEIDPSKRAAILKSRLAEVSPTWAATTLGEAVSTTADLLAEAEGSRKGATTTRRQLVLVSDLEQGSHAEALQGHQWPANVMLEVKAVAPKQSTNASIHLVRDGATDPADDSKTLRVRVANQPGATAEQFTLAWANAQGVLAGIEPMKAYVPAGRSQVVKVTWPNADRKADRLVLTGDDFDFDNTLYLTPPRTESVLVVFAGNGESADDPKGLLYYFRSAASDTARRKVELRNKAPKEPLTTTDLLGARLLVVSGAGASARAATVKQFVEAGGVALWVLTGADAPAQGALKQATGIDAISLEESTGRDFSLVSNVEIDHPLFAPFADPRFGDFTKIHFWKHRMLSLPEASPARTIARFDNGNPFLTEQPLGKGRLLVMTSGWQPSDSQLALSTKFVPLVEGLLRRADRTIVDADYTVGDAVPLPPADANEPWRSITTPDGKQVNLLGGAAHFDTTAQPGIYRTTAAGEEIAIAVNLAADESRTAPLAVEDLARWGAKVGSPATPEEIVTREQQLQRAELENRQKLWQWLILGVLLLLVAETFVAGRLARQGTTTLQQVTT